MKLKAAVKRDWLAALRSGEYAQTKNRLVNATIENESSDPDYAFCCLGVLANVKHEKEGTEFKKDNFNKAYPDTSTSEWAFKGVNALKKKRIFSSELTSTYRKLASLNDNEGWSFKRIANFIEKNL